MFSGQMSVEKGKAESWTHAKIFKAVANKTTV